MLYTDRPKATTSPKVTPAPGQQRTGNFNQQDLWHYTISRMADAAVAHDQHLACEALATLANVRCAAESTSS